MLTYDISGLDPALVAVIIAAVVVTNVIRVLVSGERWRDKAYKNVELAILLRENARTDRERSAADDLMDDALRIIEGVYSRSATRDRITSFIFSRMVMTVQTVPIAIMTAILFRVFNWQIVAMALFGPVCDALLYFVEEGARSYYKRKYRVAEQVEDDAHDDQRHGGDADVLE